MSYHIVSPKSDPNNPPTVILSRLFKKWSDEAKTPAGGGNHKFDFDVKTCLEDETTDDGKSKRWDVGARLIVDMHPPKKDECPDRIWLCEPDKVYGFSYSQKKNPKSAAQTKDWTIIMIRMLEVKLDADLAHSKKARRAKRELAFKELMETRKSSRRYKFFYEFLYYTHGVNVAWKPARPGSNNVAALYPEAMRYFLDVLNKDEELNAR